MEIQVKSIMFDFIFTLIMNMVGSFFDKKLLTLKHAIRFLLFLNVLNLLLVAVFNFSRNETTMLFLVPNILLIIIIGIGKAFQKK